MSIQAMFDSLNNGVSLHARVGLDWSMTGFGFGQLYFYEKDGKIFCSNENMGKETIKKILNIMVDQCELEDQPRLAPK
jgi:hypothetical protein